jgi:hypothetical protein
MPHHLRQLVTQTQSEQGNETALCLKVWLQRVQQVKESIKGQSGRSIITVTLLVGLVYHEIRMLQHLNLLN